MPVVGNIPLVPCLEARGFDAQVRAALHNISKFDTRQVQTIVPKIILPNGEEVEDRLPTDTARERGLAYLDLSPEEAVRKAEQDFPRDAIYMLKRPNMASSVPREIVVIPVGYTYDRGCAYLQLACLGLPYRAQVQAAKGSAANPIRVPIDADLENITHLAQAQSLEWKRRTYAYRAWLAALK